MPQPILPDCFSLVTLSKLSLLILLISNVNRNPQPVSCYPTFGWIANQLHQLPNVTNALILAFSQTTTTTPLPLRRCQIIDGCVDVDECNDTTSTPATCPRDAVKAECWWDIPGCVITKRVPNCACANSKEEEATTVNEDEEDP